MLLSVSKPECTGFLGILKVAANYLLVKLTFLIVTSWYTAPFYLLKFSAVTVFIMKN